MSIRCGKCKGRHGSAAEVRACYAKKAAPATEGMYRREGVIYKVQAAIYGSGRLYAKRLTDDGFVVDHGAIRQLTQEHRMTVAEAAEYGHLYGRCVRCQAPLTDEGSIGRGLGPVCATKV